MTLTYQQQFVLDGLAGRAAILNLEARHNRLYSAGDLAGWIATLRHSDATYTRAGQSFTDLREAFDGGGGVRLVTSTTRSRSTASTQRRGVSHCCSATTNFGLLARLPTGSSTSAVASTTPRANSNGTSCRARTRCRCDRGAQLRFAFGTYEDALDLEVSIFNQRDELCCPADVTIELPAA
jgi:hypothetical protein